jgi:2-aminoadipate transaminase
MQTAELDRILGELDRQGELPRVKLIYVVSWFENPTGISLSVPRRKELVELARRWSRARPIYVLEDAAYRELCYESDEWPSVWSFDRDRTHVILAQTFSKTFSPGLRVGFGVVPETLRAAAAARKGNEDFGSSNFNQQVISWVLEHGRYAPHVDRVRAGYRRKRDAMLAAADRYCSGIPGVHWVRPRGGLYVWMTVPPAVDTSFRGALFHHATRQNQVMYVPGDVCYGGVADPPRNQMRLSFGVLDVDRLEEAIKRLACGIQAVLERSPAASAASG